MSKNMCTKPRRNSCLLQNHPCRKFYSQRKGGNSKHYFLCSQVALQLPWQLQHLGNHPPTQRYVKRLVLSWTTESQCLDRHDVTQSDKCLPSKSSHEMCISRMELGLHSNGHGFYLWIHDKISSPKEVFSKSDCVMISVPWA